MKIQRCPLESLALKPGETPSLLIDVTVSGEFHDAPVGHERRHPLPDRWKHRSEPVEQPVLSSADGVRFLRQRETRHSIRGEQPDFAQGIDDLTVVGKLLPASHQTSRQLDEHRKVRCELAATQRVHDEATH